MAVKRRPAWVSWVPAVILSALIVGAVVTAVVLVRSGASGPAPKPTEGQVTELNWSSFTQEGLAYIERSREVRVDLSDKGADAAGLGLPSDGTVTIGPNPEGLFYSFIFKGGDVGRGGDKLYVSTIEVTTAGGEVSRVRVVIADAVGFRSTLNRLTGEAELYGWDTSIVDGIFETVAAATAAGEPYSFTFGPGDAIGTPVAATAECDRSSFCVLSYDIGPGVVAP